MTEIIKYTILEAHTPKALIEHVNNYISKGWIPKEGLVLQPNNFRVLQIMVKVKKVTTVTPNK